MKKRAALCLCLLWLIRAAPALANSWGVTGQVLSYVPDSAYEAYTACSNCVNKNGVNAAVMKNRYHCALFLSLKQEGRWSEVQVITPAVWQPQDKAEAPKLSLQSDRLTLQYPKRKEAYTFAYEPTVLGRRYVLTRAQRNGFQLTWNARASRYETNSGLAWGDGNPVFIEAFNIRLLPMSDQQVLRGKESNELLEDLFWSPIPQTGDADKLPVYAAPDASAYRAADGKASVRPSGGVRYWFSEDGWDLVEYEVSQRTHRIGYIEHGHLEKAQTEAELLDRVPMQALCDTYLTDDPFVSQYETLRLRVGEGVTVLARAGLWYAYVETETEGQRIRGFVPMGHLGLDPQAQIAPPPELLGAWLCWAGGAFCGEYLAFHADGTFEGYLINSYDSFSINESRHTAAVLSEGFLCQEEKASGTYTLYRCPNEGGSDALLIRLYNNAANGAIILGLRLDGNELSFHTAEGGGGYIRVLDTPGENTKPAPATHERGGDA